MYCTSKWATSPTHLLIPLKWNLILLFLSSALAPPRTRASTQTLADSSSTTLPWDEVFSFSLARVASSGILDSLGLSPPVSPPVTCLLSRCHAQVIYTIHLLSLHQDDKRGAANRHSATHSLVCRGPPTHNQDQIDDIAWTGDSRLISRVSSLRCKGRASQSGDVPAEVSQNLCHMLARKQDWQWTSTQAWKCASPWDWQVEIYSDSTITTQLKPSLILTSRSHLFKTCAAYLVASETELQSGLPFYLCSSEIILFQVSV